MWSSMKYLAAFCGSGPWVPHTNLAWNDWASLASAGWALLLGLCQPDPIRGPEWKNVSSSQPGLQPTPLLCSAGTSTPSTMPPSFLTLLSAGSLGLAYKHRQWVCFPWGSWSLPVFHGTCWFSTSLPLCCFSKLSRTFLALEFLSRLIMENAPVVSKLSLP